MRTYPGGGSTWAVSCGLSSTGSKPVRSRIDRRAGRIARPVLTRANISGPMNETLSLSGFASGVYVVRVGQNGRVLVAPLVRP